MSSLYYIRAEYLLLIREGYNYTPLFASHPSQFLSTTTVYKNVQLFSIT
jgi:hypothetical protein